MQSVPYQVAPERIQAFLLAHPEIEPTAINEQIGESPFYIPLLYQSNAQEHVVYFEDQAWEDPAIFRLMEWILALRFFSNHVEATVHIEGAPAPPVVQEIISLHPVTIAKLAAILGVLMAEDDRPETLVTVARDWMQQLFGVQWPEQCETPEDQQNLDAAVHLLDQIVERYFWSENQWAFHPLEYILLLGSAYGEMVRLRYDGQWIAGENPVEHRVVCLGSMDVHPAEAVIEMLQAGPAMSLAERYRLIPVEWAAQQVDSEEET